jgi:uncharacterized protein YbbC (DUF1343 family)
MKKFLFIICSVVLYSCHSAQNDKDMSKKSIVKAGIDVLKKNNFDVLKGKRIGLITNPTGVDQNLKSTIDILYDAKDVKLVALFGPEHGVRGDYPAGEHVDFFVDPYTKLPVYSIYGKTKKPTPEMLKDVDAIVYDIQDNGCRSYTFISAMGLAMEACAENDKEFIVLDRPNPLTGIKVEGNIVEDEYVSYISQYKIPYIYGLTCGELARLLNEEGMLKDGKKCKLTIVKMEGWKRSMTYDETGLKWIMPSPHVPTSEISYYYPASGILGELGVISIGVGYTLPFKVFAAEWIKSKELADKLNSYNLPGVVFRPITFRPFYAFGQGKQLNGVQFYIEDFLKVDLISIQFYFMQACKELHPEKDFFAEADKSRIGMFDKALGTNKVREIFSKSYKYSDIKEFLYKDVAKFKELSKKYYLYD